MSDYRVRNFVKPVYAVKRESGEYRLVVLFVDFAPINVENYGKYKDESPVEVLGASDPDVLDKGFWKLGTVAKKLKHMRLHLSSL